MDLYPGGQGKIIWYSIPEFPTLSEMENAGYVGFQLFWKDKNGKHLQSEVFEVDENNDVTEDYLNNFSNLEQGTYKWNGTEWVKQ
jgi:hypothetical protein